MTKTQGPAIGLIGLCLVFSAWAATTARTFPPANTDEAFVGVVSSNLVSLAGHRYSLFDDIFARSAYVWRDVFPVSTWWYDALLCGWMKAFGKAFWTLRLFSVTAGVLTLLVFYQIGVQLKGPPLGLLLAALLTLNPAFLLCTLLIRAEIILFLASATIVWLMMEVPGSSPWRDYGFGVLIGAQISIHPNAVTLCPALAILYFGLSRSRPTLKTFALLCLGGMSGGLMAFSPVDIAKYKLSHDVFWYQLVKPPIFTWPWAPWSWLFQTIASYVKGQTFYLQTELVTGWTRIWGALWSAVGFSLLGTLWVLWKRKQQRDAPVWELYFLAGFCVTLISVSLIVKIKELLYALSLFLFLVPLAGLYLMDTSARRGTGFWLPRIGISTLWVTSAAFFFIFAARYPRTCLSHEHIVRRIRELVPDRSLKLVGPNILWFDWKSENFRDIGAMTYSHWFTEGSRDVGSWLAQWQPAYLITDEAFNRTFLGRTSGGLAVARALRIPVRHAGDVDTGKGAYGLLQVYELNWHPQ